MMRTVNRLKLIRLFITTVIVGAFIGAAAPINAHAIPFFSDIQAVNTPAPQAETTSMAVQVEATPIESMSAIPIDSATATEPLETTETAVDITDSAYVSGYGKRDSPSYQEEISSHDTAKKVTAVPKKPVPFTPEGSGTVVDSATDEDGKEFFTIETPDGNTFYLIVDRQREENNVYFLNAVTENDLASLAKPGDGMSVSAVESTDASVTPASVTATPGLPPSPTPAQQGEGGDDGGTDSDSSHGNGIVIIAVIALLAAGGAGYYLKVIRPKKNAADNEDDFPDEDDEDEDDSDEDDGDSNDDTDGDVDMDDEEIVLSDDDKDKDTI